MQVRAVAVVEIEHHRMAISLDRIKQETKGSLAERSGIFGEESAEFLFNDSGQVLEKIADTRKVPLLDYFEQFGRSAGSHSDRTENLKNRIKLAEEVRRKRNFKCKKQFE